MANAKYYVKEIVRPNYLTGKVEREKFKSPKSNKKKTIKGIKLGESLKKPTVSLPKKDPVATVTKGNTNTKFVTEGEEGYFQKEYLKERQNFLGGYSL